MESHHDLWHGRRVLVTGCTGLIGAAVTRELLNRGAAVVGLVRERRRAAPYARDISGGRFHIVHGRVEDAARLHSSMAIHEVSAVFHLATADPFGHDRGTTAILRATALYHPRVPVVVARPAGGLRLAGGESESPVALGVARFGEVFGPGDRRAAGIVPRAIAALLRGERPLVESGASRDFLFARDAALACLRLAEVVGAEGEPRDCTFRSGWNHTPREMTDLARAPVAGEPLADREPEPPANPLGWRARSTFAEALAETVAAARAAAFPVAASIPCRKAA